MLKIDPTVDHFFENLEDQIKIELECKGKDEDPQSQGVKTETGTTTVSTALNGSSNVQQRNQVRFAGAVDVGTGGDDADYDENEDLY